jgi:hypothetical protein
MKTKLENVFAVLSVMGILISASPVATAAHHVDTPEIRAAAQDATLQSDHEAMAKYYENTAAQMQVKVEEQKELLEQYEKVRLYGWQSHNLKSHTLALIRKYEQAARSNMKEAVSHRQMALGLKEHN